MKFARLNPDQRNALLDLLVLAMYSDGHVALAEDERLQHLLSLLGLSSDDERNRVLDAAVTRIRHYSEDDSGAAAHAAELVRHFTTLEERAQVSEMVDELIRSDEKITPQEVEILSEIRELFRHAD